MEYPIKKKRVKAEFGNGKEFIFPSIGQAAYSLGVNRQTCYKHLQDGRIFKVKPIMQDIETFVKLYYVS